MSISSPVSPLSTAPVQHAVLEGIRFETYERLLEDLEDRRVRLTYDGGVLEIMSPSQQHERVKYLLGRLICAMTLELGIPIAGGGSTTFRRRDLEKGLEPDECFWVQNEVRVRGRMELDLRVDPPPDLAIEVDIHSRSVNRMVIYGALGVPEVWRYRDQRITVHLRQEDGSYRESETGACFPWLSMPDLSAWLARACAGEQDETSLMRTRVDSLERSRAGQIVHAEHGPHGKQIRPLEAPCPRPPDLPGGLLHPHLPRAPLFDQRALL